MTTQAPAGRTTTHAITQRIEPGRSARDHMPDADYADAFFVAVGGSGSGLGPGSGSGPASDVAPASAWARGAFESGPPLVGSIFRALAWRGVLGMRLAPVPAPGHVAGWTLVVDDPDVAVMHVDSWMLTGRLVTEVAPSGTTITTLLRFDRRPARAVWAVVGNLHRALMPGVLQGAARSVGGSLARDAGG